MKKEGERVREKGEVLPWIRQIPEQSEQQVPKSYSIFHSLPVP